MSAAPSVPIRELALEVATWNPLKSGKDDETFKYVDLSAVDQDLKAITGVRTVSCSDAPSRARQIVHAGDALVSTVRPNLNGVARVPEELDGATASTGFCVIRPNPELLDSSYVFQWVKSPSFIASMVNKATGASYPAVSDRIVLDSLLPLPPLPEQRRIAGILDKADELRTRRLEASAQLDRLPQSIFVELFGDPVTNPRGWPVVKLSEVGNLDRGVSKHRPRNDPVLLGGKHPLIQTGDVANSDGYIRSYTSTYSDIGLRQSKLWPRGTLCITIAANIAKTGILTFDACFPDSVVGFSANDDATVEYVRVWLSFLQKTLEENAPESAQKNINLAILRSLEIPLPPVELREKFGQALRSQMKLAGSSKKSAKELDEMFLALQHRAFRGEL
nr:restriction endonuclease subunit S [uncultured Rhodoferax sp.]